MRKGMSINLLLIVLIGVLFVAAMVLFIHMKGMSLADATKLNIKVV